MYYSKSHRRRVLRRQKAKAVWLGLFIVFVALAASKVALNESLAKDLRQRNEIQATERSGQNYGHNLQPTIDGWDLQ